MTPQTLVFCCNSLWGLVNFRGRVIRALVEDGHRVVLIAKRDIPVEQALALGAEFFDWDVLPRGMHPLGELRSVRSLLRMYRELRPDLSFQFTIKPVMYGGLIAKLTGLRCVSVITGLGYLFLGNGWKSRIGKAFYRLTLHRSHEVWFLNDDDRGFFDQARLLDGLAVRALPGEGVDVGRFLRAPLPPLSGPFVFLMIARLVKDKGVIEFVEAARIVRAKFPRTVFRLLGPAYSANDASVSPTQLEDWVREGVIEYLGAADDVRPAIANCHCVVLPSYREGMPRVLMEAAAMGRPAIATDVTGCRDAIEVGMTGLLCRPRDVDSLAASCMNLLGLSGGELTRMADRAHELAVGRFDDRLIIDLYRRVVDTARAGVKPA